MKSSNYGHKLVFGILGAVYAVLGGVFLALASTMAGGVQHIFSHPEGDVVAFATLGPLFMVLGVAFLIVTLLLVRADKRRARMREELLTWGQRVQGEVVDVRIDYTVRVNRRSPVIAKVRCDFPRGEVILKSPRLWDRCPAVGDAVDVLFDPMDEKRYVIEFLQK